MNRDWRTVDADTAPGDKGPLDFDPITNSQDPDTMGGFSVGSATVRGARAEVEVTMTEARDAAPRTNRADPVVRYDLVLEDRRWKIDDIAGTGDGQPWSLRRILADGAKQRLGR